MPCLKTGMNKMNPVITKTGFFYACRAVINPLPAVSNGGQQRRFVMKFLLIVLGIMTIVELITKNKKNISETGMPNEFIRHPAEFGLRYH